MYALVQMMAEIVEFLFLDKTLSLKVSSSPKNGYQRADRLFHRLHVWGENLESVLPKNTKK